LSKTTDTVVFAALNEYFWGMGINRGKEGSERVGLTWIEK
jgi:hypothetical protein